MKQQQHRKKIIWWIVLKKFTEELMLSCSFLTFFLHPVIANTKHDKFIDKHTICWGKKDEKSHTRTRICYNMQKPEVWSPPRECVIKIYYPTPAIREFQKKKWVNAYVFAVESIRQAWWNKYICVCIYISI
jgi:ribosomal protein L28